MFKETLAAQQPVVYRMLSNALTHDELSHCYLFAGPRGTLKKQTAVLLAQSFACAHPDADGFACESCAVCRRIAAGSYVDMIRADGSQQLIKAEVILAMQAQFSQTALEAAGKKIFILNDADAMTLKAANSLLKFIEEPAPDTLGIFITSAPERMLPTIVSRCQMVSFKPLSADVLGQAAKDQGLDPLDARLISAMVHGPEEIPAVRSDPAYAVGLQRFLDFLPRYLTDPADAVLFLQENGFKSEDLDRKQQKQAFGYFLNTADCFINDLNHRQTIRDDAWNGLLKQARAAGFDSAGFLLAVTQAKDALNRNANPALLLDRFLYQITGGCQ